MDRHLRGSQDRSARELFEVRPEKKRAKGRTVLRIVLGLLEAGCAVVTTLIVLLLVLNSDVERLRAAYNNDTGGLVRLSAMLAVTSAGWLVLWRLRTGRRGWPGRASRG